MEISVEDYRNLNRTIDSLYESNNLLTEEVKVSRDREHKLGEHSTFFDYVIKRVASFHNSSPVTNKVMGGMFVDSIELREDYSILYYSALLECLESYKKRKLVASFLTDIFLYSEYILGRDEFWSFDWDMRFAKTKSRIEKYITEYSPEPYS